MISPPRAQILRPLARHIKTTAPSHFLYPGSTRLSNPAAISAKHEFLVIIPDREGVLEKRMGVMPQHLKDLAPKVDDGFWTFGGAMLNQHLPADQTPSIKGSVMLATAASSEEVMEQLRKDVYAKGVWDLEKVEIIPFRSAVRKELK